MEVLTFKYEKEPGSISERVLAAITQPSDKYFGIDISELDFEDQGLFVNELDDILEEQKEKIDALMVEYDIKHKYRTFLAAKMSEIHQDN